MKLLDRTFAVAVAAVTVLSVTTGTMARADTPASVWERARDPQVATRDALHAYVEQALDTAQTATVPVLRSSVIAHARDLLLEAHAETSPDPRLRFDLGEVYERLLQHERAVVVLSAALKDWPNAPGAVDAIESLSFAFARLDRPREERATYFAYLARVTDERARGTAVLNLAEAEMRLGNLPEAVARYRESVQIAANSAGSSGQETTLLATWGLAVALDRSGDPNAAQAEARLGTELDPGERTLEYGENVFFVPEYERHWYVGLALAEEAKQAVEPHYQARYWEECEKRWAAYVKEAAPTERWLPLGRKHLAEAHAAAVAARAHLEAQAKKRGLPDPLPDPTPRQ
jgi:tetratricopeptide (TPR) repeat protein